MRAVIDTNVIAYHLLGASEVSEESARFLAASTGLMAPALWEAELANVVWMATRAGALATSEAPLKLGLAAKLGIQTVPNRSVWQGALLRAVQSGSAVYDTLFVELAAREGVPLVTFDQKLARAWPAYCCRPRDCHAG